jgi:TolB-like protein/tRNA A-37 threonylcarbamoyl transferase component Bud32
MLDQLTHALTGRYRLERELGRGGMATVYLAHDLKHDRRVALKVLSPEVAHTLGAERFLREIRVTAGFDHPHILPLLDSGQAGDLLYYLMPYVEGESLRDRLTREKRLPLGDALRIAREVAGALAYAHSRGIIHRDIKPENILLAGGHARVADFGIARAVTAAGATELTETGVAIGTLAYMSPEQAGGQGDVDGRSDVYALGCVLYEMLAGRAPFTGTTAMEIIARHALDPLPSLAAARPGVPPAVERAIATALAKSPSDRFPSADRLAEALAQTESDGGSATVSRAPAAKPTRPGWRVGSLAVGAVGLVALLVIVLPRRDAAPPPETGFPRTAIAVLPFQDLSGDREHAYFAGGLHDELLTQLSKVASLRVISRTSVMRYAGGTSPIGEIARALRVGSVVEGTVQVVGGRLRVNVQLIDAASDAHLWADRYDRTLDDAFAIQSDVVQHVVSALGAALSRAESQGMSEAPTANAEAYRLYLQGREYFVRPGRLRQDYEIAQQLYERAVALDPGFALARVALVEVHGLMRILRYDVSPDRLTRVIAEADTAIRLAPGLPKALEATGMAHSIGRGDFRRALEAFRQAAEGLPNDARLRQKIGFTNRVLGNWDDAIAAFRKSTELDPYDADLFFHLGLTESLRRRFPEAVQAQNQALSVAPDLHAAAIAKSWAYARGWGQLDTLETVLKRLPDGTTLGPLGDVSAQSAALHLWRRSPGPLLEVLGAARSPVFEWELSFRPVALFAGWAHQLRGDPPAARASFDTARRILDARLAERPDDWQAMAALGLALAGLGDRAAALAQVRRLERRETYRGGYQDVHMSEDRARILAQLGEAGAALDEIERLLKGPSWLTVHSLRLDPIWDPIRDHPRFRALLPRDAPR